MSCDSPIVNNVLQTMKRQLFMNTVIIDGNSKPLSVECCLETKMRRDVKLLYDVMQDTIRYTSKDESCEFAARLDQHAVHVLRARYARDEIINLLRSALRVESDLRYRSWYSPLVLMLKVFQTFWAC